MKSGDPIRLLCAVGMASLAWGSAQAAEPAQIVLRNGVVITMDAANSRQSAVAVRDGKLVFVGSDAQVGAYVGPATRVVDLHGLTVMPGLIDSHSHPMAGGHLLGSCSLNYEKLPVAQFRARIQACLDKDGDADPDKLLTVQAWFEYGLTPEGTVVDARLLDGLRTRRPIAVASSFGHSTLLNRRAIEMLHLGAATPDPVAGKIVHGPSGEPTGLLEDAAQTMLEALRKPATPAEEVEDARGALAAFAAQGVTSFMDAAAEEPSIRAFTTLAKGGALTARAHFAVLIRPDQGKDPQAAVAMVKAMAAKYDSGPLRAQPDITVRHAKLFLDGVMNAPTFTAAMLAPYFVNHGTADKPDWGPGTSRGPDVYFSPEALVAIIRGLGEAHIDAHMHGDGDGAVRAGLDAVEKVRKADPRLDLRPAIAHDELVDPADFGRYKQLNVAPVLSYHWAKPAPDTVESVRDYFGPARYRYVEPEGVLEKAGARITFGSDWPVDPLDEWFAIKVGVTREAAPEAGPQYRGRLSQDPGLSREAALRGITINGAYHLREDTVTGSLEPGKLADFIVLDRDPQTIPAADIAHVKVLETVVGGRVVYTTGAVCIESGAKGCR